MEFLSHILPRTGYYVLAEFEQGKRAPKHNFYSTVEQLEAAVSLKDSRGKTVYHACATYKTDENRKAANAGLMRSLWLDIDVGKANDANSYETKREAMQALGGALIALALPKPTIVSSGKGFHCYFTFDRDITSEEWKPLATAFANALRAVEFKQDPSRTKDAASVLRPVGSTWRKGDEAIEVKLLHTGSDTPVEVLREKLSAFAEAPAPSALPASMAGMFEVSNDLGAIEYPPSSAYQVIKFCGAMRNAAESGGSVPEPYWRGMLGIVKNCIEGDDLCHEWSSGYSGYNRGDTQRKIDGWTSGPTTCSYFSEHSSHCVECKFNGKIKSPIQLGIPEEETTKEVEVEVPAEDPAVEEPRAISMPQGFNWDGEHMGMAVRNADGVVEYVPFCRQLVVFSTRNKDETEGTYEYRVMRQVKRNDWREFAVPGADISCKPALIKLLGSFEVVSCGAKGDDILHKYFRESMDLARKTMAENTIFNTLGWYDSNKTFVLGQVAVTANGIEKANLREGSTHIRHDDVQPSDARGDVETWAMVVNQLFNVPHAEAAQFVICNAFASPLIDMMKIPNWHGIPVGLSGKSGKGKTSVCNVGLSVFGPHTAYSFQSNSSGTTDQARIAMYSKYKNLPILQDEITELNSESAAALLYAAANGRGKVRLNVEGNISKQSMSRWAMSSYITCQNSIPNMLAAAKASVTEATSLRCFSIDIDSDPGWNFVDDEQLLVSLLSDNYGVVGQKYLQFLIKNRDEITKRAVKYVMEFAPDSIEVNERYYRRLVATVLFAAKLATALGIIEFDLGKMRAWAERNILALRNNRAASAYTPEEFLNELLGSLHGRTIVTKDIRDARHDAPETSIEDLRFGASARRTTNPARQRLIVSSMYITEWLKENRIDKAWFLDGLKESGFILSKDAIGDTALTGDGFRLGTGTTHATAKVRVVEFDCSKLSGQANTPVSNVVKLATK